MPASVVIGADSMSFLLISENPIYVEVELRINHWLTPFLREMPVAFLVVVTCSDEDRVALHTAPWPKDALLHL